MGRAGLQTRGVLTSPMKRWMSILRWPLLVLALVLLNAALTFANVWPTLAIRLTGDLSLEAALGVLGLMLTRRWVGVRSGKALGGLAAAGVVLIAGRYIEVTAESLYGRDINLYWDLRHLPNIGAMFAYVASPWLTLAFVVGAVVIPAATWVAVRWALGRVNDAAGHPVARPVLTALSLGVVCLGVAQGLGARLPEVVHVAPPVSPVYVREFGELVYEMSGAGLDELGPPPAMQSDLSRVAGADVFLIFLESYGAVSWDRPAFVEGLAASRARFETDIRETGRSVVSARVESTTFGGESWLAHISLLSGTEVRDEGTNVRLMAQERDTLVTVFGRRGYRTVAIMPGLLLGWPQGAFYDFEDIYDHERLDYHGPPFGWWDVTDQFSLARVDALEIAPDSRRPVFSLFTTITTHAPFTPAPPYQPDWARMLTSHPYDPADLDRAWSEQPDWMNLGPSYVKALSYAYATVGGYLRHRADRDLVVILVGDHQPPALVSGEGASWDVPVHVIATRDALLDRLIQHRFREGLAPAHPPVARLDTLLPMLLDAFGEVETLRPAALESQ